MSTTKPEKDYFSATRFAHSIECGARGWDLSNPSLSKASAVPLSAFERGSFFHSEIEKFYYTDEPISMVIPQNIFFKLPPKSQVVPIKEEVKYVDLADGTKLKCIGYPDVPTKEMVVELKSGDHKKWHVWQLAYYLWLMDLKKGRLVYFDSDLVVELQDDDPTYRVTDELIRQVWANILEKRETRGAECPGCPLKRTCTQWTGTATEDMLTLVELKEQSRELEAQKKSMEELFVKPINARLKELSERYEATKQKILAENDINNYSLGSHRVRIQTTTITRLPEGFSIPAYSERPDLYKAPEQKLKVIKDEFGVKVQEKQLVLELEGTPDPSQASG